MFGIFFSTTIRPVVRSVEELVAAHLEGWTLTTTEEAVFGTSDPHAIASLLQEFCTGCEVFGSGIRSGLFYWSSVGCVVGVELADGRRMVIKVYQRRWCEPFLAAVGRVQHRLSLGGFPCPDVLAAAQPVGPGLANVETLLPDPGLEMSASAHDMSTSAAGLAEQIGRCRKLTEPALAAHPLKAPEGELYPRPHSPFFDFSARSNEVSWIDKLALEAIGVRDAVSRPPIIAHTDWSARNIRIRDQRLVAVYDWDSLALVPEIVAVGQAAATWRSTGDLGQPVLPDPGEIAAYNQSYERAAGISFTRDDHRAARAAALWVLCYTARCEHAIEVTTGKRIDQARTRLQLDGSRYLA